MSSGKAKNDTKAPGLLQVVKEKGETDRRAMARTLLRPSVNHALTIRTALRRDVGEPGLAELVDELSAQCAAVSRGELGRPEALLTSQAHTLDALFNDLTRIAFRNLEGNFDAAERLFRLAFKAQAQSRAAVETVGNLKNPPMVLARQANISHGPQQVNNSSPPTTHAREFESEPSKLLEQTHGERLDTGTTGQARNLPADERQFRPVPGSGVRRQEGPAQAGDGSAGAVRAGGLDGGGLTAGGASGNRRTASCPNPDAAI